MLNDFRAGMAEATRLTRAGRLEAATAFIHRLIGALPGARAPEPAPAPDTPPDRPNSPAARTGRSIANAGVTRRAARVSGEVRNLSTR